MSEDIIGLADIQKGIKSLELQLPDLFTRLDQFTEKKPASLTRLVYEQALVSEEFAFKEVSFDDYLNNYIFQTNPFIQKYAKEQIWTDYLHKYQLMSKERIVMALRNTSRQRRQYRRFMSDL